MQDIGTALPYLLQASVTTLWLAVVCIALSSVIGLAAGILCAVTGPVGRSTILSLVYVLRGIPILVQLFLVYFGLPFVGLVVNPYGVAIVAISLHMGALIAEIVRGSLLGLPQAQSEGGLALGLTPRQVVWKVLMPQALVAALPPYISLIPVTIKATAIVLLSLPWISIRTAWRWLRNSAPPIPSIRARWIRLLQSRRSRVRGQTTLWSVSAIPKYCGRRWIHCLVEDPAAGFADYLGLWHRGQRLRWIWTRS